MDWRTSGPPSISTSASAKSSAVPGPREVMTPRSTTTASPTTVVFAASFEESGITRGAAPVEDARRREHHGCRADCGDWPAFPVQALHYFRDAGVLFQVVGAWHAARQRDHVELLLGKRGERRVCCDADAVRARHRAAAERRDHDLEPCASQHVDDGDGLEFLKALGKRDEDALHAAQPPSGAACAVTSAVLPVLSQAIAARISGSRSPAGCGPGVASAGSGNGRSGSSPRSWIDTPDGVK